MIIFGWGFQMLKNFGPVFKQHCNHCGNEEYWILTRIMTWFTLFFIPVFPYEIKYFLSCPICKYGLKLESAQVDEIKPLAEANQLLIDGKITESEYKAKLILPAVAEEKVVEAQIEEEIKDRPPVLQFCSSCGTEITTDIKFCGNCGVENKAA